MDPEQAIWDESVALDNGSIHNSSKVVIEASAPTLMVAVVLMVVIAACGTVMGLNLAKQAEMDADYKTMKTQAWLVERRLMDAEAYAIVNGTKLPADNEHGPTGNLQRMKPH
ncbi:MAG TPA: hypothetical protein VN879_15905 [Candidatus Acidoferrales bacterium]|nr:hypothetical protein [Candidatus Acidoferrales bacterium]